MSQDMSDTQSNIDVVKQFVEAWSRLDVEELVSFFAQDGIYHNMPTGPVQGHEALGKFITGFSANWQSTQWELLNIVGDGNIVIAERLDKTRIADNAVDLPCTGVFEMESGKIKVWRDYFDLATYTKAITG